MKRISLVSAAALLAGALAAGPAFAASPFDGPYAGVGFGYGMTNMDINASNAAAGASGSLGSLDTRGGEVNILGGYGMSFGSFYAGGELDGSLTDFDGSASGRIGGAGAETSLSSHWSGTASVRAGYLPTPDLMLYGRLGGTRTQFQAKEWDSSGGAAATDQGRWGLTAGAGIEAALAQHVSLRGEYRYTWYDDLDLSNGPTHVSISPEASEVRAALVYTF